MSVKDHVINDQKVRFVRLANNELIYVTDLGFEFPIPLEETQGATFLAEDRAILFMRWIARHMKHIEGARLLIA